MKVQALNFPAIEALPKSGMQKINGGAMSRKETPAGEHYGQAYECDSELYDNGVYQNTTYTFKKRVN
ncbi:hypothetical protein [Taibaiella chishuiensis]|uniref:Uncharacterized protein n=1 Tax=Taibaiella chishuiensis TaxID=1434707 RepID=A0A2P8D0B9_9BACT|nr:hypothetical protein [Taibaiella chishuiensis]PSK90664.1 hypothetical protein B0I18_10774 [Taibaiella chishuiensis]